MCWVLQSVLVALLLTLVAPARAQRSVNDKAAAEALFDEALDLMKEKRYAEACPKLEESQRIDAGIGTLLYLAECYEKSGRTASAWATFREAASAASAAGQAERALQGKQRADQLEERLSKLTILVAPEDKRLQGFKVTRGGQEVLPPLFDAAVPVDPGQLVIEATAPGHQTFSKMVTVPANGGRALVQIPPLVAIQPEPIPPAVSANNARPQSRTEPTNQSMASFGADTGNDKAGSGTRTAGVVLMGVGAAGLVVGSIFGLRAIKKNNEAEDHCGDATTCGDKEGVDAADDANTAAWVSNVGFLGGAGLIVGGVLMYTLAPNGSNIAHVSVAPLAGGAHLGYSGRF